VDVVNVAPGVPAITVQDDGVGMARANLHCMLSFGFSSKEHVVGNVGRFGIGFKSGSMRLANDALILTRREGQASVALLSTTFLNAIDADDILIPMFTWKVDESGGSGRRSYIADEPSNTTEWEENMAVIEEYTFLKSEAAVLEELDKIDTKTGTRIVLFNLKQPSEFDFEHDQSDIRMRGIEDDVETARMSSRRPVYQQHRPGQQMTLDVPEDYSLRAYIEVLYLRPTVTFTLRGEKIVPRSAIERLAVEYYQFDAYTPKGVPEERASPIIVHCGYAEVKSKHCGFHIYNKNRLIRMYQRYGSQLQANAMMKDMLGVVEADCLEPTHNKQAFNTTDIAYTKCQRHIEQCMNDYYFGVQKIRLAGLGSGNKRRHPAKQKAAKNNAKKKSASKKERSQRATSFGSDDDTDEEPWEENDDPKGGLNAKRNTTACAKARVDPFPRLLRKLMRNKNSWAFNEPVDAEYWGVPDYYERISTPMDFGTIATQLDNGDYRTEGSAHGPLKFVTDVRQVFYNAWTYNQPGHQVYGFAQDLARIFETDLAKIVGENDEWGLLVGNTRSMAGPAPEPERRKSAPDGGGGGGGGGGGTAAASAAGNAIVVVKSETGGSHAIDAETIKALVDTRAAQAIAEANKQRDEAYAALRKERASREAFEAELEAQTTELIRSAREEAKMQRMKLEEEKETLMGCLKDSNDLKRMLQEENKALKARLGGDEASTQI